jgi:hypothetical protein
MERDRDEVKRRDVERELEEQMTEAQRQSRGSTPSEHVVERALEVEPGVEQHAGEDPGALTPPHDPDRGEPE